MWCVTELSTPAPGFLSSAAAGLRVDPRRPFIDRTPHLARAAPLPHAFRVATDGRDRWPARESMSKDDFERDLRAYQELLTTQSITCWHASEVRHPVHFFEQRVRCRHCGRERFRTTNKLACCRGGQLLLDARLPNELLNMMTGSRTADAPISAQACKQGISKCSRALNNKFRFAQMRLPKVHGKPQKPTPDSFQHLRITGIPYAQIENLHVMSSTRSFLDDPCERMGTWAKKAGPRGSDRYHMQGHICICMNTRMHMQGHVCICMRTHMHMQGHLCICMHTRMHIQGHVCICMHTRDRCDEDADGDDGMDTAEQYTVVNATKWAPQPHATEVRVFEQIMLRESPLVDSLVNYAIDARDAFLVLRYEGTTSSVRAFTTLATAAVEQPREVAFSLLQDGSKVNVRSTHPMYPALMWPLFFPRGQPLPYRKDGRVMLYDFKSRDATMGALSGLGDDTHGGRKECWSIAQMALALLYQPEKRASDDSIVRHPTESPYPGEKQEPILRPFSKLELCGRLGDEVLLDMFLAAEDARLFYLSLPSVQKRITGQFQQAVENADDEAALSQGSYLPPSVQGAPRQLRECIANALAAVNDTPCEADLRAGHGPHSDPMLFGTLTVSVKEWLEVQTELPVFGGVKQDPFDRAGLTTEVFHGKIAALLARLRTGTAFPNIGRPKASSRAWSLRNPRSKGGAGLDVPPHANAYRDKDELAEAQAEWLLKFNRWAAEWKDAETRCKELGAEDTPGELLDADSDSDESDDGGDSHDEEEADEEMDDGDGDRAGGSWSGCRTCYNSMQPASPCVGSV